MRAASALLAFVLFAPAAFAARSPKGCEDRAGKHVLEKFKKEYFFQGKKQVRWVDAVDCELKKSKKGKQYNDCDVYASNGHGAGDVDFKVMSTASCAKVIASFMVGME